MLISISEPLIFVTKFTRLHHFHESTMKGIHTEQAELAQVFCTFQTLAVQTINDGNTLQAHSSASGVLDKSLRH